MAVEDAELLALAGGDTSDEDDTPLEAVTHRNANSPLPSIEISQPSDSRQSTTKKAKASLSPNVMAKASKTKKARKRDSDEDDEVSSSRQSPDSLQSAPMSESDSGASRAHQPASDEDPFPIENKFKSESDKRHIMALPEIQREEALAERAAIFERNKQDQQLRSMRAKFLKSEEAKASVKRKADTDADDSPRKSTRQKTTLGGRKVGESSKVIERYKKTREVKGLENQQRKAGALAHKTRRARSTSDRNSSADADGESEVEWDDGRAKVDEDRLRNAQPADYHDFRRTTVTRFFLAEFCYNPGFEEKLKNCYVRLPQKSAPGAPSNGYQLVQIQSIVEKEGWPYAIERQNGKRLVTSHHLMLIVDGSQKDFHMNSVSNSMPTEVEVANHKNTLANEGKAVPTRPFLNAKIDDINSIIHHSFTAEELNVKLQKTGAIQSRKAVIERIDLQNRRKAAVERGDESAIAKCDADLAELNGPKLKYGTSLTDVKAAPSSPAPLSQQERLAEINRMNRKKNTEEIRKAQIEERKAARRERQAVERGEALQNPFARVKIMSKTHYDVNATLTAQKKPLSRDISRSATPGGLGTPKLEAKKPARTPELKPVMKTKGLPVLGSRNMDDEFIASMDLGIDIEI